MARRVWSEFTVGGVAAMVRLALLLHRSLSIQVGYLMYSPPMEMFFPERALKSLEFTNKETVTNLVPSCMPLNERRPFAATAAVSPLAAPAKPPHTAPAPSRTRTCRTHLMSSSASSGIQVSGCSCAACHYSEIRHPLIPSSPTPSQATTNSPAWKSSSCATPAA